MLRKRSPRRFAVASLTTLAGLGAGASVIGVPAASASTLAYVKGGAAWVSAPDGSDAHEVAPGLTYPSLADDGTVYGLAGNHLVDLLPPGRPAQPAIPIVGVGATALAVSPDGGQLAWQDVQAGLGDLQSGVSVLRLSDGRRTDWLSDGRPRWFSASALTMAGPNGGELFDAATNQKSTTMPDVESPGFDTDLDEYAVDRAGNKGAALMDIFTGGGPPNAPDTHTLVVFPVAGGAPATDTGNYCVIADTFHQPIAADRLTWSPDGSTLAWEQPDGIHESTVPSASDCGQIGLANLAIAGASQPDWGPSDDRRFPEPPASHPQPTTGSPLRLTSIQMPKRLSARQAARHGIRIRLTVSAAGTVTAVATVSTPVAAKHHLHSRTLARGTIHVHKPGRTTVLLRVTKRDIGRLKRSHHVRTTLTIRLGTTHVSRKLALR